MRINSNRHAHRRGAVVRSRPLTAFFDALTPQLLNHRWIYASMPRRFSFQVHGAAVPVQQCELESSSGFILRCLLNDGHDARLTSPSTSARSINADGLASRCFITGINEWPPAKILASGLRASRPAAWRTVVGRWKVKLYIGLSYDAAMLDSNVRQLDAVWRLAASTTPHWRSPAWPDFRFRW